MAFAVFSSNGVRSSATCSVYGSTSTSPPSSMISTVTFRGGRRTPLAHTRCASSSSIFTLGVFLCFWTYSRIMLMARTALCCRWDKMTLPRLMVWTLSTTN